MLLPVQPPSRPWKCLGPTSTERPTTTGNGHLPSSPTSLAQQSAATPLGSDPWESTSSVMFLFLISGGSPLLTTSTGGRHQPTSSAFLDEAHDQARRDIWSGGKFNTDPRRLWDFLERIGEVTHPLTGNERKRERTLCCHSTSGSYSNKE